MSGLRRRPFLRRAVSLGLTAALVQLVGCGDRSATPRPTARLPRIGYLTSAFRSPADPADAAFRAALAELGYRDGSTIRLDERYAEGQEERLPALAAELVALPVDVLVVAGPAATVAARQATTSIPIVMASGTSDPVLFGWVESLARPGTNLTGTVSAPWELHLEKVPALLREVLPSASRVAVVFHGSIQEWLRAGGGPGGGGEARLQQLLVRVLATFQTLGLELLPVEVRTVEAVEQALAGARTAGVDTVMMVEHPLWSLHEGRIMAAALAQRLPVIASFKRWAASGALLTYGPDLELMFRRAAPYVAKLLNGVTAAELPIEQPTTFDLVLNLKTARLLGLSIPPSVLAQATAVIE
jgi:ABC-type uncharacterized transport system substrate-binding protein